MLIRQYAFWAWRLITGRKPIMKILRIAVLLVLLAALLSGCADPTDVEVGLRAPATVKLGEEFVITATVKNTAAKTQTLVSLDVGDAYLKGIAILATEPDHRESMHVPLDNTRSYVFRLPVKPGKELSVLLRAKAVKTGDFDSEIDFCINSDASFLTKSIRTIVE